MCFGFLAPPNIYYVDVDNVTKIYTIIEVIFNLNLYHDMTSFIYTNISAMI